MAGTHSGSGGHRGTGSSSEPKTHIIQPSDHFGPSEMIPDKMKVPNSLRNGETIEDRSLQRIREDSRNAYNQNGMRRKLRAAGDDSRYEFTPRDHFIRDDYNNMWHSGNINEIDSNMVNRENLTYARQVDPQYRYSNGKQLMTGQTFSGSTTDINPTKDPDKESVITYGLEQAEINRINNRPLGTPVDADIFDVNKAIDIPPVSPLQPFTRMLDPDMAQVLNTFAYNRFHYPIADLEHRKAFRNLFFTRPECYIYCTEGKLSEQCEHDDTIASSHSRYPHISKMLSPVYVTGTFGPGYKDKYLRDNINYMLSNRAKGFSITEETLSVNESVGKSIEGYTVVPGMHVESHQGGTISVSFTDTKYLEIYEYFRIWMNYIYKRKKGVLEPPFAKYSYKNNFPTFGTGSVMAPEDKAFWLHPYDRALEYCASLFDFVTNEANDRILYWCKYYGIYPISLAINGLNSESNQPMAGEITVDVTFRYQYKLPCENKSLVEFNFNTGITDVNGHLSEGLQMDTVNGFISNDQMFKTFDASLNNRRHNIPYIGGANMFVGTPYIVMNRFKREPTRDSKGQLTVWPYLKFLPLTNDRMNTYGNLGITSYRDALSDGSRVIGSD